MTAIAGMVHRVQGWVASLFVKPDRSVRAPHPAIQLPLVKLPRMLIGIAQGEGRRRHGIQLMVDALNVEQMTCKCRELLSEGEVYTLALLLQGVGHVKFEVEVDWVLLSSYGHSAGLKIHHTPETRQALVDFVGLLEVGARG